MTIEKRDNNTIHISNFSLHDFVQEIIDVTKETMSGDTQYMLSGETKYYADRDYAGCYSVTLIPKPVAAPKRKSNAQEASK